MSTTTTAPNTRTTARRRWSLLAAGALAASAAIAPVATTQAIDPPTVIVFDDMEHGDPEANGWFAFPGSVGGGGIGANSDDLPPSDGGAYSLQTGWGSGGVPGFYGGFGRTSLTDLTGIDEFSFWINPDAGQEYTLEVNLQDDDDGNDLAENAGPDDEYQFNCVVSATGPCAVAGGGWQQVTIPLSSFVDDNSFFVGGNGALDPFPVASGGNGQLVNVVMAVIGTGGDVNFRTDNWTFTSAPVDSTVLIDDFENGLPSGADADGVGIGFQTFSDPASSVGIATTATPPAPVPDSAPDNDVLAVTGTVGSFGGVTHSFENGAIDTWVPQDWSGSVGLSFWLYGLNTGRTLFVDVLDNRNPGSTTDDAERFFVEFVDDFSGWQKLEFPFSDFARKEIGNGAPNDGFTLTQVHGWAFGLINTPGEVTYHLDDVSLYGIADIPELAVTFVGANNEVDEGATGAIRVRLNRPMNSDDPAQVSVDFATEVGSATPGVDYTPTSGTLTFLNGGPSELTFALETLHDTKWEGTESVILRLSNPIDVAPGFAMQAGAFIVDDDVYDPFLLDDFERFPHLWDTTGDVALGNPQLLDTDPLARPGQDAVEGVLRVDGPVPVDISVQGNVCKGGQGVVQVRLESTDTFDATTVDHRTVRFGNASEAHVNRRTGEPRRHEAGDDLVFHFEAADIGVDCGDPIPFNGETFDGQAITAGGADASLSRDFPLGQDWSAGESLSFWYYGTGSGERVTVDLKDNRAADPGPSGWTEVWSQEFNEAAGTPPDPEYWSYEIGDGTVNGIPGWGNDERQYYTDSTDNVATDGNGNLVLTVQEADGSLECYYGPCEYTSARLVSKHKAEFAYGRIESRILVPDGESGLWPAFWSLGTDIDLVGWPQTGEIDFMEYVSRLPDEIFGTIHGPGYSGGQSYSSGPVFIDDDEYHTYAVEWYPDLIEFYLDGELYHTASPADVPGEWVFNDPVYLLLNVAIGGNFGGTISPDLDLPASMLVDYVRVYQGPDTAERFEASFVDDFAGWQRVTVPFESFTRSDEQPAGAPDDGLTLSEVWGYGFSMPDGLGGGTTWIDQVAVDRIPPPTEITVESTADSGSGSLRAALAEIADGGTISIDPALAGQTVTLSSGPLNPARSVTIDATGAPGFSVDGAGTDRVLLVGPGLDVAIHGVTLTNGYGFELGGCVINNGNLMLDRSTVTGCAMTIDEPGEFWKGGGGIYNGDGATLDLVDSTVSNNTAQWSGGGVYSFFNTTTTIVRSTISGNVSNDVGGGLRLLGDTTIENSTISGNTSTGWHGGAIFQTDGDVTMTNSTVTDNAGAAGAPSAIFVGQFGGGFVPTLTLTDTIVAGNQWYGCEKFASGTVGNVVSGGGNVFQDDTCNPSADDQVVSDPGLDVLADNDGPTQTHALLAGSPAIDAAVGPCPETDQRGVARPQGAGCDVGAFELEP